MVSLQVVEKNTINYTALQTRQGHLDTTMLGFQNLQ